MYISNSPTFGTQSIPVSTSSYLQPQVVTQPIAPTGYVSPFAAHGGYFPAPTTGGSNLQVAPPPMVDPIAASYASNHPSYMPRTPIHPSEQGLYMDQ